MGTVPSGVIAPVSRDSRPDDKRDIPYPSLIKMWLSEKADAS
jgi:hypothetical protein